MSLLIDFFYPRCFVFFNLRAHQQQCRSVGGTIWDMRMYLRCYWGSVSEWLPWALSRTRHRVSWSKQLCRNSNTLLFSPWPVLQNIVCTSVILPTPWAHREPPPHQHHHYHLSLSLSLPSPPCFLIHSQRSCPYSFSPSCSVALTTASFPFPLTQRYSQANTPTHFLTLTPIHKHTKGLEDTPMCEDHTVLMCQSHCSLLNFSIN